METKVIKSPSKRAWVCDVQIKRNASILNLKKTGCLNVKALMLVLRDEYRECCFEANIDN
jgi:hypothetical protein